VKKPDDATLSDAKRRLVRRHAEVALRQADALGTLPTPIADIMSAAELEVTSEEELTEGFLKKLRSSARAAGETLRRALSKVLGALHVSARTIYLDPSVPKAKRPFIKLHETGHAVLPWQREIYRVTEDCQKTLEPEIAEQFEREANIFAAEVLFQLDAFSEEAFQQAPSIWVPVKLSKRYGASIYMAIRRYVSENPRPCAVIVTDMPQVCPQRGYVAALHRVVVSPFFRQQFGELNWPAKFSPDDNLGAIIPVGKRKASRPREIMLIDRNRARHRCLAEAFTQGHNVFILIHSCTALNRTIIQAG